MKKKTLKGMTLMEVIIAIAVFAVFGVILVTAGTTIDNITRATTNLKTKVSTQSPYAANQLHSYVAQDGSVKNLTGTSLSNDTEIQFPTEAADDDKDKYKLKDKDGEFVTEGSAYSYSFTRIDVQWTAKVTFESAAKIVCEVFDENGNLKAKQTYLNNADWKSYPFYSDKAKVYVSDVVVSGTKVSGTGSTKTIEFKNTYAPGVVEGVKYSTKEIYDDRTQGKNPSPYNNNLNLKYIEVGSPAAEPPTESPTT